MCLEKFHSTKNKAVELRKAGYSHTYIAERTGVSKSTLSSWLGGLSYKPNTETVLKIGKARAASGLAKSLIKLLSWIQLPEHRFRQKRILVK